MSKQRQANNKFFRDIVAREHGIVTPLNFCQRQAAHRVRNLSLSRLRTIGVTKEADDAPEASNRNLLLHRSGITSLDIESQEWRYVLAGGADGSLYIHDIANFRGIPHHNSNLITAIKGSEENRDDHERNNNPRRGGRLNPLLSTFTPRAQRKKTGGHYKMVTTVQWFPEDSGMFITSGMDGVVKMWDANTLDSGPVEEFDFPNEKIFSHHLSVTENHSTFKKSSLTLLAVASESNHINLLDLKSGSSSHELRGHSSAVMSVKWSPYTDYQLASGDRDGHLLLWDVRRAKNCLKYFDFDCISRKSDLSNSNKRKNSGSKDPETRDCKRLNLSTRETEKTNKSKKINQISKSNLTSKGTPVAHNGTVNGILFCDDGKHLISFGCHDGRTRKWDLISGINKKVRFQKLPPNKNAPNMCLKIDHTSGLVPSPGLVFIPSEDSIVVFDSENGDRLDSLNGHYSNVNCCVFNPHEQELISGGSDRNILIWESNQSQSDAYLHYLSSSSSKCKDGSSIDAFSPDVVIRDNWSSSSEDELDDT